VWVDISSLLHIFETQVKQDTNRVPRDYEMVQAVLELELYILVRALRSIHVAGFSSMGS